MRNVLSAQFTADVVAQSMSPQFRMGKFGKGLVFGVERYVEAVLKALCMPTQLFFVFGVQSDLKERGASLYPDRLGTQKRDRERDANQTFY